MTHTPKPEKLDDTDLDAAVGGVGGSVEPNDGVRRNSGGLRATDAAGSNTKDGAKLNRDRWIESGGDTKI